MRILSKKTPEQITKNMKAVKNKGSKIEVMLMKELWSRGLRYRKNVNSICGKPDIVFKGKKVTASFGMGIIGKNENMTSNLTKSFGYRRLNAISSVIRKSIPNLKPRAGSSCAFGATTSKSILRNVLIKSNKR